MPLPSYRVVTQGETASGYSLEHVRDRIRSLCKYRPETLDQVFSGKSFIFKAHLELEMAEKYKAALDSTGILSSIELMPEEGNFRRSAAGAQEVVCPKCGHRRKPHEAVPQWQCPRCLVAYEKFRDLQVPPAFTGSAATVRNRRGGRRQEGRREGGKGSAFLLRFGVIAVLLLAGYVGVSALGALP